MITVRRADERRHDRRETQDVWQTFYAQAHDHALPEGKRFGMLRILNEEHFPPGSGFPIQTHKDAEIITYVREGSLAHADSMGGDGVIHAGKFQMMSAGSGVNRSETNASITQWAHVFQIWILPSTLGMEPSFEREHFSVAERRGGLRVVASPDARKGSLRIEQDALVFSSVLEPGRHVVHELAAGHSAWLHVVEGEVTLGDIVLTTGDGAGATGERAVSFTAREPTEILLIELGVPPISQLNGASV